MRPSSFAIIYIVACYIINLAFSHSVITYPEPFNGGPCPIGGKPGATCPGPCDISVFTGKWAANPKSNYYPPNKPVPQVFKRGQKVAVKYTRNNHAPSGFMRFTLIRYYTNQTGPEAGKDYMDKAIHTRNAFHYSCWGARRVVATPEQRQVKKYSLTTTGTDGAEHTYPVSYHVVDVLIPPVVPDGLYILGWVWFGGTGGNLDSKSDVVPFPGFTRTDFWSCSFIKIQGGAPLAESYTPIFNNDYNFSSNAPGAQGMENGCMAQSDAPDGCVVGSRNPGVECAANKGSYRKPAAFQNGIPPPPLTPVNFGGKSNKNVQKEPKQPPAPSSASPKVEKNYSKQPVEESPMPTSFSPKEEENEEEESPGKSSLSKSKPLKKEQPMATKYAQPVATDAPMPVTTKPGMPKSTTTPVKAPEPIIKPTTTAKPMDTNNNTMLKEAKMKAIFSCICLKYGSYCSSKLAGYTAGCKAKKWGYQQPEECRKSCCSVCKAGKGRFCRPFLRPCKKFN